tara:strand:+ start:2495 stop:4339 length:1845 start_codon:yes stop_codon:yes gene_type:complete
MENNTVLRFIKNVLENMPSGWLSTTTHRLDIYDESLAKTQFLDRFESLFNDGVFETSALNELPTAYDYIRLGHPLSCILEWAIAKTHTLDSKNIISFSSKTIPVFAILRKNLLENKNTQIIYTAKTLDVFDVDLLKRVYGYTFNIKRVENLEEVPKFDGSTIFISKQEDLWNVNLNKNIDFIVNIHSHLGSILVVNGAQNQAYISEIQHVRRRETIAMTPANCFTVFSLLLNTLSVASKDDHIQTNKASVLTSIKAITGANTKALVASSGLSIQYAIMMGLIDDALSQHKGKAIKIIVPPNCYGGTNDQARRVAACIDAVEIVDLPVDGHNNMVKSIDTVLAKIAHEDAIPYIIAEIPTNPRVEVPDLVELKNVLSAKRTTSNGKNAIDPVFILDQTFCPNVHFLGETQLLARVRTISYASGSKFPSGGQCTAGYCIGNKKAGVLMENIEKHLKLCDNEATALQYEILATQLPSMNQRIKDAYKNTQEFVDYIHEVLPEAKINFVSSDLVNKGFTPSVFSLDLPTKGNTAAEKETYKRALNHTLINAMITKIPQESKYCVSYGQLKGCYWTIPATSTQGTTKEGDKDYIARVSVSANMDLELHKKVFLDFVAEI